VLAPVPRAALDFGGHALSDKGNVEFHPGSGVEQIVDLETIQASFDQLSGEL
jgi:hypothetical protein